MLTRPLIALVMILTPLTASCTPDDPAPCPKPALGESGPNESQVVLLIQPPDNFDQTGDQVSSDVASFLKDHSKDPDSIVATGYIYSGEQTRVDKLKCLNQTTRYGLANDSPTVENKQREDIPSFLGRAAKYSVVTATPSPRTDVLPLLSKASDPAYQGADVLLWSTFFWQTDSCLKVPANALPVASTAVALARHCNELGLIPNLNHLHSMKIKGIGTLTSPEAQRARAFSESLALEMCTMALGQKSKCSTT